MAEYDAVVIGSGPNGLACAIRLAREGRSVLVVEAQQTIGGGVRSAELAAPGFLSDLCSAIHPMALASPFFRTLPLERFGLEWIRPPAPAAHPLDDAPSAVLERSAEATAAGLGADGDAWRTLAGPLEAGGLLDDVLRPLAFPSHPLAFARFGLRALRSVSGIARRFRGERARALWAGLGGHSIQPFTAPLSAAAPLGLLAAAGGGWAFPRGGAQALTDALAAYLRSLGGEIVTGLRVTALANLPASRAVFFDTSPFSLCAIAGGALPSGYRNRLMRFRSGPGVFKLDWALDGPVPWTDAACARAATVHLGGTLEEIARAEEQVFRSAAPLKPYVLFAQQSLFDASRAPAGKHVAWAYCHVPPGSDEDMTARIEAQVERFAPGFRDLIVARSALPPAQMQAKNANYIGGDIGGGALDWTQLLTRPVVSLSPWRTPDPRLFLCSASTPPGPGVHGMCGMAAAEAALATTLRA